VANDKLVSPESIRQIRGPPPTAMSPAHANGPGEAMRFMQHLGGEQICASSLTISPLIAIQGG